MEENTIVNDEPVIEVQETVEEVIETAPPGAKTDSALLLKSLQEERDKRRDAEAELQRLKDASENTDVISDEGRALQAQIAELKDTLRTTEEKNALQALESTYSALKDKASDFEVYRLENPGMKLETAAKAFLTENDLLPAPKPRKGLETTNGGGRVPQKVGLTPDEIDDLRVKNYPEYTKRLRAGTLFS